MSASITQRLHEGLHALPGMPAHSEAARRNQHAGAGADAGAGAGAEPAAGPAGGRRSGLASPNAHHSRPPRVLAGWQTWIGEWLAGRNRQG